MNHRLRPILAVSIVLVSLTIVAFAGWWFVIFLESEPGHLAGALKDKSWGFAVAVATMVYTLVVLLGGVAAIIELRATSRQLALGARTAAVDIAERAINPFFDAASVEHRRRIYGEANRICGESGPFVAVALREHASPEFASSVRQILESMDRVAFMLESIGPELGDVRLRIVRWLTPMIAKTWIRIGAYVEAEATARNESEWFFCLARALGKECIVEWSKAPVATAPKWATHGVL